jgi:hypothetical protein
VDSIGPAIAAAEPLEHQRAVPWIAMASTSAGANLRMLSESSSRWGAQPSARLIERRRSPSRLVDRRR